MIPEFGSFQIQSANVWNVQWERATKDGYETKIKKTLHNLCSFFLSTLPLFYLKIINHEQS